ncbi:MAG: hypothetical protein ABIT36_05405, partial [Steroidobacteraceae bacterium]
CYASRVANTADWQISITDGIFFYATLIVRSTGLCAAKAGAGPAGATPGSSGEYLSLPFLYFPKLTMCIR